MAECDGPDEPNEFDVAQEVLPVAIPDARVHAYCTRCKRWFDPDDGAYLQMAGSGPVARLQRFGDRCIGRERKRRFVCHGCMDKRAGSGKMFAILLLAVFLCVASGLLIYLLTLVDI